MSKISPQVREILASVAHLKTPKAQIRHLEERLRKETLATKIDRLESFSVNFGGSAATTDLNFEDPRFDDGVIPWDEIGLAGAVPRRGRTRRRTQYAYDRARDVGRALSENNGYAIGAHKNRQDYLVGSGVMWTMVAEDQENEDEALTKRANQVIKDFQRASGWLLRELEAVQRADRDGEWFARLFLQKDGPLKMRWVEPSSVRQPGKNPRQAPFGIEVDPNDAEKVLAYYVHGDDLEVEPRKVLADTKADAGDGPIPHVVHAKFNVDQTEPRGWPLMWAARRALVRCEKSKANMNRTLAIQSSIALLRTHEGATAAEVQSFLDDADDMKVTNNSTGKDTNYRGVGGDGGAIVVDSGPGISYQAPISSVNPGQNVPVVDLELRAIAAQLNLPEFVFSGKMDSGFANSLVGETPFIKHVQKEQAVLEHHFRKIVWAAVQHEVFWRRLPKSVLTDYRLNAAFPDPQIRQPLPMAQTRQIQHTAGVLSTRTWQEQAGLDPEIEKRNGAAASAPDDAEKPPAGSTDDGPGGADMKGNEDPKTSPQNTGFSPEEG
jgi:hypothetical protein